MTATDETLAIIAALRAGERRHAVADRFGASYARVCAIAKANGIPKNGYRHGVGIDRARQAIEAYAKLGTMEKAGAALGVSRQAIEQLISRYEAETGLTVPRSPPPMRVRADVFCRRCGILVGEMTRAAAEVHSGYCRRCVAFAGGIPDAQIEEWITAVKAGALWIHLAEARGIEPNAAHSIPLAIYKRLWHDGRLDDIAAIWPRGVPRYILNRVHARKPAPSVRIPHLGRVNGADKKVR